MDKLLQTHFMIMQVLTSILKSVTQAHRGQGKIKRLPSVLTQLKLPRTKINLSIVR